MDSNTLFNIGSVTKVFTALATMQLYEQGKLNIDQPVTDYVPAKRILGYMAKSESMYFFMEEIGGEKLFIESNAYGGLAIIGQQFVPVALNENWKKAIGKYNEAEFNPENPQMISNLELTEKNGIIMLRFRFIEAFYAEPIETALQPIDENTAYIAGLGRNGGEQVRLAMDHEKQQITLDFAGLRFLKE